MSSVFFSLSLLTMLLFASGRYWRSRRVVNLAYACLVLSSLLGWYENAFATGLQPEFFIGTVLTVPIICFFFYVIYNESEENHSCEEEKSR